MMWGNNRSQEASIPIPAPIPIPIPAAPIAQNNSIDNLLQELNIDNTVYHSLNENNNNNNNNSLDDLLNSLNSFNNSQNRRRNQGQG